MNRMGMIPLGNAVNIGVFSILTFFLFVLSQGLLCSLIFFSAIFVHELSHIFTLKHFGAEIKGVYIYPFGIDICADTHLLSYKKELAVTLAGGFANLICASLGSLYLHFYPSETVLFFVLCHFSLGIFNLLPLSILDGGRAVRLILYDKFEIDTAYYIQLFVDGLSSVLMLILCSFAFIFSDFNLSVLMLTGYSIIAVICLLCAKKCGQTSAL